MTKQKQPAYAPSSKRYQGIHRAYKKQRSISQIGCADVNTLECEHLGIISKRCYHWHRKLPARVKRYYDVEDMISDVVLHIVSYAARRYTRSLAAGSTYIWHVTDNKCKMILAHHSRMKYCAPESALTPAHDLQASILSWMKCQFITRNIHEALS